MTQDFRYFVAKEGKKPGTYRLLGRGYLELNAARRFRTTVDGKPDATCIFKIAFGKRPEFVEGTPIRKGDKA